MPHPLFTPAGEMAGGPVLSLGNDDLTLRETKMSELDAFDFTV